MTTKCLVGEWIFHEDFKVENLAFSEMAEVIINVTFTTLRRILKILLEVAINVTTRKLSRELKGNPIRIIENLAFSLGICRSLSEVIIDITTKLLVRE